VKRAWATLAAIAIAAVGFDAEALRGHERPLIDRHTCVEEPSPHTRALDGSLRGDVLYRFVYGTLFGLGERKPRAGFPHVEVAPVCTLGWKDPVAAIKIGAQIFLVKFEGTHVVAASVDRDDE